MSSEKKLKTYKRHVFVCLGKRCEAKGSEGLLDTLKDRKKSGNIPSDVLISRSGCLSVCKETENEGEYSPVMVVYPEGVWYKNVTQSGLDEIIKSHLKDGRPVAKFLHFDNGRG